MIRSATSFPTACPDDNFRAVNIIRHFSALERLSDYPAPLCACVRAGAHSPLRQSSERALPLTTGTGTFYLCNTKLHPPYLTPAKPWGLGAHPVSRQTQRRDQARAATLGEGTPHIGSIMHN